MRARAVALLPVPIAEAWRTLLAWETQARWMRDAGDVRVVGTRREGVGTRISVRTRVLGVLALTDVLEVTVWDPPVRLALAHRGVVRGVGRWRLEPAGARTRFVWVEDLSLPIPVLGELALWVYRPFMVWLMRASLRRLQALLLEERDRDGRGRLPPRSSA